MGPGNYWYKVLERTYDSCGVSTSNSNVNTLKKLEKSSRPTSMLICHNKTTVRNCVHAEYADLASCMLLLDLWASLSCLHAGTAEQSRVYCLTLQLETPILLKAKNQNSYFSNQLRTRFLNTFVRRCLCFDHSNMLRLPLQFAFSTLLFSLCEQPAAL